MARTTLTRRELYDLVWSSPITKLAGQFGISDVGLLKTCQRYRVPTPPRGYWAKVEAGRPVKKAVFVEASDPGLNTIEIGGAMAQLPEPVREIIQASKSKRQKEKSARRDVAVQQSVEPLADVHSAVLRTVKALRKAKPDEIGGVRATGPGLCGVLIGKQSVERAAVILDGVARAFERKGLVLQPIGDAMKCAVGLDEAKFTLKARTRREKHVPSEAELEAEERRQKRLERSYRSSSWDYTSSSFGRAYPEFDTLYTGELSFEVDGYSEGVRRKWADGRVQRLEALTDDIASGIETLLAVRKLAREEREERSRKWEELERRRALAKSRQEREQRRIEYLNLIFERQRQAGNIRQLFTDLRGVVDESRCDDLGRFVEWARARLTRIEGSLTSAAVQSEVSAKQLFPEVDPFHDPHGEPPEESRWRY